MFKTRFFSVYNPLKIGCLLKLKMTNSFKTISFIIFISLAVIAHSDIIGQASSSQGINIGVNDSSGVTSTPKENLTNLGPQDLELLTNHINQLLKKLNETTISGASSSTSTDTSSPQNQSTPSSTVQTSTTSTASQTQPSNSFSDQNTQIEHKDSSSYKQSGIYTQINPSELLATVESNSSHNDHIDISSNESNSTITQSSTVEGGYTNEPANLQNSSTENNSSQNEQIKPKSQPSKPDHTKEAPNIQIPASQTSAVTVNNTNSTQSKTVGLCTSDQDCLLAYGQYVSAGLKLVCNTNSVCAAV